MSCGGMGYMGKAGDGASVKLFTKAECDKLGGNWLGNGECLKKEGGSFSWDCRNEAPSVTAAASRVVSSTAQTLTSNMASSSMFTSSNSWMWIGAGLAGAYVLLRMRA